MTVTEAERFAAAGHKFRGYKRELMGSIPVVRFDCWAGCPSTTYLTDESARAAHERHQQRMTSSAR